MREAIEQFRAAIHSAGLHPPEAIEADGKLHRFAANGKRTDDAGWYVLHGDGIPAGAFGDWRSGTTETWRADIGRPQSAGGSRTPSAAWSDAARARGRGGAGEPRRGRKRRGSGRPRRPRPTTTPTCWGRGKAHGLQVHDGALVIPIRDGAELHSLQFIGPEGDKRFLSGGRVSGCHFLIGKPRGAVHRRGLRHRREHPRGDGSRRCGGIYRRELVVCGPGAAGGSLTAPDRVRGR